LNRLRLTSESGGTAILATVLNGISDPLINQVCRLVANQVIQPKSAIST
jgi:hypothetical protein